MLRQGNSRNQRSKGFRMKHILQICLLLAISIWLLYQLKHSYDKKIALEARNNAKIFDKVADTGPDFFKLGRKGLLPGIEETDPAIETHNKEEESEVVEEEEEPETKQETEEEHGRGAGDDDVIDEIDEHDQERGDEEADLRDEEDKVVHDEGVGLLEEQEQELEGREGDSQEAREENYKRDDASSAVRQDTRTAESELGNGNPKNSEMSTVETVDGSNGNASNADLGENQTTQNGTDAEKSEPEVGASMISGSNSTGLEHELQTNSTESADSNNQMELQAKSTANVSETTVEMQSNSTEVDAAANGNVGAVGLDSVQDQNATVDTATHGDDKPDLLSDAVMAEQTEMASRSENGDAARGETDESSVVTAEEREVRADLSTLPSIQNEAKKEENVAAE